MVGLFYGLYLFSENCEYTEWSTCSKTCGGGKQQRQIKVDAKNGGKVCDKELLKRDCKEKKCPSKWVIMARVWNVILDFLWLHQTQKSISSNMGDFQLLDLIIMELKSHMTC